MSTVASPPLYDEIIDLLTEAVDVDRVLRFQLSPERQQRLDALLERNREGALTADEKDELSSFERFEHIVRVLKARAIARQLQQ